MAKDYPALSSDLLARASNALKKCGFRWDHSAWVWREPFSTIEEWNDVVPAVVLGQNRRGRCFFQFRLQLNDSVWIEFREVPELIIALNASLLAVGLSSEFIARQSGYELRLPDVCSLHEWDRVCGEAKDQPVRRIKYLAEGRGRVEAVFDGK